MSNCFLTDTFPAFLTWRDKAQHLPLEAQISGWEQDYLAAWPELLRKQIDEYAGENQNWRQIARTKVFPHLSQRLPAMKQAHDNLVKLCPPVYAGTQKALGLNADCVFVIYTGIGLGAGWATKYNGLPSVLFGLENIAECGWESAESIRGLAAHELGHLAHHQWRAEQNKAAGAGPWWQLYEEGFAQCCESLITGTAIPHQSLGNKGEAWLAWCCENRAFLAREFLQTINSGKPVNRFFGSWYEIHGKSETGYYLGAEIIRELNQLYSLKDIALLDDIAVYLQPIIEKISR
jgi:hypothetical protein